MGFSSPKSVLEKLEPARRYLSRWLVQPWRELFPEAAKVRWLAEGELRDLPLASLYDLDGRDLVQSVELTYLDGPACQDLTVAPDVPTLLVGGADDLPGANQELAVVRRLFPQGPSWKLGQSGSELAALAGQTRLVHIATHGLSPSAARLAATLVGTRELSTFELSQLSLPPGTLAVVGACQSAVDAGGGRDNTSLVSALRTAGAEVVVGAQWDLEDQATCELFGVFYSALRAGATPEAALVKAQRATSARHPHPFYWAGLQVVSGPGR